mmetsp:Transcript_86816/g.250523  ORF Transcript_86816/g.250523 Transcript_86816/m.250523 type:complete len:233 (-) Transcript_86816:359-1057(-)
MAHNVGGGERRRPASHAGLFSSKSDSWSSEAQVRKVGSCMARTERSCRTWLGAKTARATTRPRRPLSGSSAIAAISAAQGPPQAFPNTTQLLCPSASIAQTVMARKSSGSTDGSGAKSSGIKTVRPPSKRRVIRMTSVHSLATSSHAGMPWSTMTRPLLAKPPGSKRLPMGSTTMQPTVGKFAVATSSWTTRPPSDLATSSSSRESGTPGESTWGTQWPWAGGALLWSGSIW